MKSSMLEIISFWMIVAHARFHVALESQIIHT